jgi:hypothetical protein
MSCSCHINPPCSYCVETYECRGCGELKHPQQHGQWWHAGTSDYYCDRCSEQPEILKTLSAAFQCVGCDKICHLDEHGKNDINDDESLCDSCVSIHL